MAEDTPLAVGQVHGFRAWRITQDGLLTPISQQSAQNWHDGENVASCVSLAGRSPEAPQRPVPPRHPDDVDPAELIHAQRTDYGATYRAGRQMRIEQPREHDRRRTLLQLFPGDTVEVAEERRRAWAEIRQRAIDDYARATAEFEKRQQLYEHDYEIFLRRYEEYEQEVQDHIAPVEECQCGFYMVRTREKVPADGWGMPTALGVVQGYGRVVSYEDGWRFGKGRIIALMILNGLREPRHAFGIDSYTRVIEIEKERNDDLAFKLTSNYPSAKFYTDHEDMMLDWKLVVSES